MFSEITLGSFQKDQAAAFVINTCKMDYFCFVFSASSYVLPLNASRNQK